MKASLKRLASIRVRLISQSERKKRGWKRGLKAEQWNWRDILSLLANRMASVCASGSPSLTSAAAFQTQLRSLPTLGESFMSGTTSSCG